MLLFPVSRNSLVGKKADDNDVVFAEELTQRRRGRENFFIGFFTFSNIFGYAKLGSH